MWVFNVTSICRAVEEYEEYNGNSKNMDCSLSISTKSRI